MGDFDPNASQHSAADMQGQSPQLAFQTQFDFIPKPQQQIPSFGIDQYGPGAFHMGGMAGALPQAARGSIPQQSPYDASGVLSSNVIYHMHNAAQYTGHRPPHLDMNALQNPQQQYGGSEYSPTTNRRLSMPQRQSFNASPGMPRIDSYGYTMTMPPFTPVDPRFSPQAFAMNAHITPDFGMLHVHRPRQVARLTQEAGQFNRRASEPAPIPSFPRGPPRKPKQSGHALWVGNLPPAATVIDLKDHFSREATKDIESLFLISKSNCAFVNYRTEAACVAAMNRFHDSRFHGVRLVCRLRRGSTMGVKSPSTVPSVTATPITEGEVSPNIDGLPTIVASSSAKTNGLPGGESDGVTTTTINEKAGMENISPSGSKVPERFFIIKSLTVQDLEASVQNGTWATQSHNETALNEAYNDSEHVYLVFSANKSGEYFGYARMASLISGEPVNLGPSNLVVAPEEVTAAVPGTPQSISTPATETAPKGRIIDDSARGTIFWEAEHDDNNDNEGSESPGKERGEVSSDQNWGKQFKIEWLSTSRLPFYRTRGLRNPWNANREVKIARDGTELEPGVGRRLAQMFHRPPPSHVGVGVGVNVQGLGLQQNGVPYH